MNILFTAYDVDGDVLHTSVERVANWAAACKEGMTRRNALVADGIRVTWAKHGDGR